MAKARRSAPTFYTRSPGATEQRVPCGEFHTQSGKVGATIRRSTDRDGRVTYSYTGQWGAGSGHSAADMQREVDRWMRDKRGFKVVTPFVAENPLPSAAGSLLDPSFGDRYRDANSYDPAHHGPEALVDRQRLDVDDERMRRTHRWDGRSWVPRAAENPINFQQGERLRIRSKGPQGQPFEAFWFTVPSPMTPEEVALQFAQTDQPGMLTEIVQGKSKWTYRKGLLGGQSTVTRVRAAENPVIRYSDQDILRLLRDTNRPAWERTAHITAAARQRGYSGDESNQERMIHFLEASLESVVPEGPGYEDASLRHARENPRGGSLHVEVVELPKWGSDRSKWAVKVNGKTVGSYWNKEHADKKAESLRSGVADNPLDTSVDGWTRWHGDPPNEVGNLGPGQQVQTADGWWYRADAGSDAGHLFFQAADPNGPVMLGPAELVPTEAESIAYETATFPPVDVDVVPEVFATPLPPTEELSLPVDAGPIELPIEAVENPITNGDLAGKSFKYLDVDWELSQTIPSQQGSDVYTAFVDQGRYGGHGMIRVAVDGSWRDAATLLPVGEVEPWITYVNRGRAARGLSPLAFRPEARENPRGRRGGDATAWRSTPDGDAKYRAARAEAQQKANEFGYDYGIEPNDIFKSWNIMMLPRVENRAGYELRVEVVHPEGRTQAGHGPGARENPRRRKEPNEFLQGLEAKKAARAAVFAALQSDPVYNRLFERKDAALRAWNQADAYKNHPAHKPGEVEAADRRAKYAMKQVNDYEEAALRKAGCW